MNVVELLKRSNHYANHRAYTEKVIKDYVEIAQPLRLKYPNVTRKMLIDTQRDRNGGRGTEPFDSKEKMTQIEGEVLGIIGSKFNSASRQTASRTTFANSIRENPKNFTIYNAKIKAENQKIIDMESLEEIRLAKELQKQVIQNEIKRNSIIPKIIPATIPSIDPAVLPSIVATSSLIPLGVLAILLLNSSRAKK